MSDVIYILTWPIRFMLKVLITKYEAYERFFNNIDKRGK